MLSKIYEIRRLTLRLEDDVKKGKYKELLERSIEVEKLSWGIREQFKDEYPHLVKKFELAQNEEFKQKEINELDFLFKPVSTRNVFEGQYIVKYSEERSAQLESCKALNAHNSFWSAYDTIYGTIYGSVPTDLIDPPAAAMLMQLGWENARVKVIEFGTIESREAIIEYCEAKYEKYIIVKEKKSGIYLVLYFIV